MLRHCIPICWTFGPVQIVIQNNETHPETNLLCSSGCVSSCKDSCISLFTRVAARACLLFVFCRCKTPCFGYVLYVVCVLWNAENMHGSLDVVYMLCFFWGVTLFFSLKAEQTIKVEYKSKWVNTTRLKFYFCPSFHTFAWFRACVG